MNEAKDYQYELFNNPEVEEELIGMILLDSSLIKTLKKELPITAFTMQSNRLMYRTFLDLEAQGKDFNLPEIISYLNNHQLLDSIGGMQKVSSLLNRTLGTAHLKGYVRILLEKQKRRDILELGNNLIKLAQTPQLSVDEVLSEAQGLTSSCLEQPDPNTFITEPVEVICTHHVRDDRGEVESTITLSTVSYDVNQLNDLASELQGKAAEASLYRKL